MSVLQMKHELLASLLLTLLTFSVNTNALTVDATEVGVFDNLLASYDSPNSGLTTELLWIESIIGTSVTSLDKIEYTTDADVFANIYEVIGDTDAEGNEITDSFAIALTSETDYFLIKTTSKDGDDTYLFENLDDFYYAYFTLSELGIQDVTAISHITTVVPIPAAVWLFGTALLGLVCTASRTSRHFYRTAY